MIYVDISILIFQETNEYKKTRDRTITKSPLLGVDKLRGRSGSGHMAHVPET